MFELSEFETQIRGKQGHNSRTMEIFNQLQIEAVAKVTTETIPYCSIRGIYGRAASVYILNLAMYGLTMNSPAHTTKAISLMMDIVENRDLENYKYNSVLSMGDMAHTLAIGYDWLSHLMTPEERLAVDCVPTHAPDRVAQGGAPVLPGSEGTPLGKQATRAVLTIALVTMLEMNN